MYIAERTSGLSRFTNGVPRINFYLLRDVQICVEVAVAILEECGRHLQICSDCFGQVSESWLMGLLLYQLCGGNVYNFCTYVCDDTAYLCFQDSIAIVPLVVYVSGFITSLLMRYVNKAAGRKVSSFLPGFMVVLTNRRDKHIKTLYSLPLKHQSQNKQTTFLSIIFFYFFRETSIDILCYSSAWQMVHMKF